MINKLTIEEAWRRDPYKSYYVIQNPKLDRKKKKMLGLTIKFVEYKVRDWDKDAVNFERVNKGKDKRFPEVLVFDKQYPDAENEVYSERVSNAKKKPDVVDSYAVFNDQKMARYNKLVRLHRVAEELVAIHGALKGQKDSIEASKDDSQAAKDAKKGIDVNKINLNLEDIAGYFEEIQATNYFDELEAIQSENPDLASM